MKFFNRDFQSCF